MIATQPQPQQEQVIAPAGLRPNTQQPTTLLEVAAEDLWKLTNAQLIEFAENALGILIKPEEERPVIMMKLVNAASGIRK